MYIKKIFVICLVVFGVSVYGADKKLINVHDILESSGLKINYEAINSGKTVVISREDQERTDTAIALSMILYVKAPYEDVLGVLNDSANQLSGYKNSVYIDIKDIDNAKTYFTKIGFRADEMDEVDELFDYDGGDKFNLSKDEIQKLQKVIRTSKNHLVDASSFFQEVLYERFQSYLKNGVKGISDYEHSDSDATVKKGIEKSTLGMIVFKNNFPNLYAYYMNYPNVKENKYIKEKFAVVKDKLDGRVVFILKHQLLEQKDNFTLIAQREFYISNSLDAIQTQIVCLPYKDGTFVALSSQSYTNKVSGFARGMAVKIGRKVMASQIRPMFDMLEKKFNK